MTTGRAGCLKAYCGGPAGRTRQAGGGSANSEEGSSLLRERSPQFQASRIAKPLLMPKGPNDPRVTRAEADQMVKALRTVPMKAMVARRPRIRLLCGCLKFPRVPLGGLAEPIQAGTERK